MTDALLRSEQLITEGQPNAAVTELKQAVASTPGDWRLHDALGNALLAARRDEEALGVFLTAVRLNPKLSSACVKIAQTYFSRGLDDPGVTWLRRAMEIDQNGADYAAMLAAAELRLGHREVARELLEAWVAAAPENAQRRHLALAIMGETTPPQPAAQYVTRLFDGYAVHFDKSLSQLSYCGPELVVDALARGAPALACDILDVGCGTGLVGLALRPQAQRLAGVDVSQKMVQQAALRGVYDELHHADMTAFMTSHPSEFDVVAAADVLTYVGELGEFCRAAATTLRPHGQLVAALEMLADQDDPLGYRLNPTGRFSHSAHYLRRCLEACQFAVDITSGRAMRTECGRPAPTLTVLARHTSGD